MSNHSRQFRHALCVLTILTLGLALHGGEAGEKPGDADNNPLPEGALRRFGSLRWRHGENVTFVAYPEDGKTLITAGQDAVLRIWDIKTGNEIRHFVPPAGDAKDTASPYLHNLTRAAATKDGKLLAVAMPTGKLVQVWDGVTGKPLHQIKWTANGIAAIAFSPDATVLAIRGVPDRTAILYDAVTGKEIRKLKAKLPEGKKLNISGGAGDGTGLAFTHDGKRIALPELEYDGKQVSGSVTIFETDSGKELTRIETTNNGIGAIAFAPDDSKLVFNTHSAVFLKDVDTGKELHQLKGIFGAQAVAFAPDGKTVAVKGRDQSVRIFDVATADLKRTITEPGRVKGGFVNINSYGSLPTDIAYSPDGKTLILGGLQAPRFVNLEDGKELPLPGGGHAGAVSALLISGDGKTLISRGGEGVLRVWNRDTGKEIRQIDEQNATSAVRFSSDRTLVALGGNDGTVRIYTLADGKQRNQFKAHQGSIAAVDFSADGKRIVTRGAYDGTLRIFDANSGAERKQITYKDLNAGANGMLVRSVTATRPTGSPLAFSPDGKTLAVFIASQDVLVQGRQQTLPDSNCLRLYDVETGREYRQIPMPKDRAVVQLSFSLDGRLLISDNSDKTVSLWEIASGQERANYGKSAPDLSRTVNTGWMFFNGAARTGPALIPLGVTIAVSRDGSLLAAQGPDHSIKVYDSLFGKELASFPGHRGKIAAMIFAPDGKSLISGGHDTTILAWDLSKLARDPAPAANLDAKQLDALWADLGRDAIPAGKALQQLVTGGDSAIAALKDRVQPAAPLDPKAVEQWLRNLDNDNFAKRAVAIRQLEKMGELAVPAIQKKLASKPSLETRRRLEPLLAELTSRNLTAAQIRIVRAVEVLDRIGGPEARQLLERLADGAPGATTTIQAQAALERAAGKP